jgi:hypothetical protein
LTRDGTQFIFIFNPSDGEHPAGLSFFSSSFGGAGLNPPKPILTKASSHKLDILEAGFYNPKKQK